MPIRKPQATAQAPEPEPAQPLVQESFSIHLKRKEEMFQPQQTLACLVTGDIGVGKSTFAATFPQPLVVFVTMGERRTVEEPYRFVKNVMFFDIDEQIPYETRDGFAKFVLALRKICDSMKSGTIVIESVHQLAHHFRGWCGISRSEFLKPWGDEDYRYQRIGDMYRQLLPELLAIPRHLNVAAICATQMREAVLDRAGRVRTPAQYGLRLQGQWLKLFYNDWPQVIRLVYKETPSDDGTLKPKVYARLREDGQHSYIAKININVSRGKKIPTYIGPDPTYEMLCRTIFEEDENADTN